MALLDIYPLLLLIEKRRERKKEWKKKEDASFRKRTGLHLQQQ